jgi:uncharacterized protein YjiS (DUF1127 family)
MLRNSPNAASLLNGRSTTWRPLRIDFWRIWLVAVISTVVLWLERGRSRRVLATLDDHQLRDIGVTRAQARLESAKPFWRD